MDARVGADLQVEWLRTPRLRDHCTIANEELRSGERQILTGHACLVEREIIDADVSMADDCRGDSGHCLIPIRNHILRTEPQLTRPTDADRMGAINGDVRAERFDKMQEIQNLRTKMGIA